MSNNSLLIFARRSLRDALKLDFPVKNHQKHLEATIDWLSAAQDSQTDGGVSAYYAIKNDWAPSFIETTGYIIPTFLKATPYFPEKDLLARAKRMADFLLAMQLPNGGFRTYPPTQHKSSKPTVFNTGQDILGLCAYYEWSQEKKYLTAAIKASQFLAKIQNDNGSWTTYETDTQPHTYHSRVGWALIWTGKLAQKPKLIQAGTKALDWVSEQQEPNGWLKYSLLPGLDEVHPITHTIAYAIEGLWYGGLMLKNKQLQQQAILSAQALYDVYQKDGELWATYDKSWEPQSEYVCLTGNAQIATLWLEMAKTNHQPHFRKAATEVIKSLKSKQDLTGSSISKGGVAGSYPVYGSILSGKGYCRCAYINWAAKFFADALLLSLDKK